jgi:fatty-acyl-CoA synthase
LDRVRGPPHRPRTPCSAACAGVPDERWQERPRAYVVLDSDATGDQLREFLMERFPKFWVPDVVQTLQEIPLTSVGKFDKKALRQRVQGESASSSPVWGKD